MVRTELAWPLRRLGDALTAAWGDPASRSFANPSESMTIEGALSSSGFVSRVVKGAELEAVHTVASYDDFGDVLAQSAPCLVFARSSSNVGRQLWVVERTSRGKLVMSRPDGTTRRMGSEDLRATLVSQIEGDTRRQLDQLLTSAGVSRARTRKVVTSDLLDHHLAKEVLADVVLLRPLPSGSLFRTLRSNRVPWQFARYVLAHLASYTLLLLAWWWIGGALFDGITDRGMVWAWPLLLLLIVPARMATTWFAGVLGVSLATTLRRRLLVGSMALDPDKARLLGAGSVVGRILESTTMETLAIKGVLGLVAAAVEIVVGGAFLASLGLLGPFAILVVVVGLMVALQVRFYRRFGSWMDRRLDLTHLLVENISGHRNRLHDVAADAWHNQEELRLNEYCAASVPYDETRLQLQHLVSALWMALSLLVLIAQSISFGLAPTVLAAAIGLTILLQRALNGSVVGGLQLGQAVAIWRRLAELQPEASEPSAGLKDNSPTAVDVSNGDDVPVLEARNVSFSYPSSGRRVLENVSLTVSRGDQVLLQGPSGQGKSTLAAVLCGQRTADYGLLTSGARDASVLHDWSKRFVLVPQFYKNHLFSDTLAFNLLAGRGWPASDQDIWEARKLCSELGLDPLLESMPSGLDTVLGDSGWQLSHGERARVFVARALLQNPTMIVFDESFSCLDPTTLEVVLKTVRLRSPALMVIAHP